MVRGIAAILAAVLGWISRLRPLRFTMRLMGRPRAMSRRLRASVNRRTERTAGVSGVVTTSTRSAESSAIARTSSSLLPQSITTWSNWYRSMEMIWRVATSVIASPISP